MTSEAALSLKSLVKMFDTTMVVRELSLDVEEGELLALLGPSGCGKSTTLRMIAGLERPSFGRILSRGRDITDLPPHQRDFGLVFQNYALFPHLTVLENVAYGLRRRRMDNILERARNALDLVQLSAFEGRFPNQLSGGQQQRVALARAVVVEPSALLLDEPLSNLDVRLRTELRAELNELRRRMGWTSIFVTHDQLEALSMADRIAVMNNGVVEQIGTPTELFERPRNSFVATFVGDTNILRGKVVDQHMLLDDAVAIRLPVGASASGDAVLSVRPDKVSIAVSADIVGGIRGHIINMLYSGSYTRLVVELPTKRRILADVSLIGTSSLGVGDAVIVHWNHSDAVILES
ncbi:hypothetical protein N182_37535 [Sinorhizobium sp. GL2]|nr:hypothetical protein N182_37535 [Sinorhizobium sp. GL2]